MQKNKHEDFFKQAAKAFDIFAANIDKNINHIAKNAPQYIEKADNFINNVTRVINEFDLVTDLQKIIDSSIENFNDLCAQHHKATCSKTTYDMKHDEFSDVPGNKPDTTQEAVELAGEIASTTHPSDTSNDTPNIESDHIDV